MLKYSNAVALAAALLLLGSTSSESVGAEDGSAARVEQLRNDLLKNQSAAAAVELAKTGEPGAEVLHRALKQPQGRPAALAAWALWQHPNRSSVDALRSILWSKNQVAAYWAARALGAAGDPSAVDDLAGLMPEEPNYYWEQAHGKRVILRNREARNVDAPIEAPDDMPNIRAVYAALIALGEIGGPVAEATLVEAAGRPLYLIRHAAALGLGTMKAESQLDLVRRLAQDDPVVIVRDAAREAAAKIEGSWRRPEAPLPSMPDALVFIKTANRSESNLGFRDSYFVDKTPWYHSGENLYLLSPVWPPEKQQVRNLTNLNEGAVQGPEISFDGDKILFAMRPNGKTDGFHIYEMNVDGAALRQITDGNCNDVDPCYLADGRIMFCSDRAGYHEFYHQERSRVLYVMEADGSDVHQVTFNPNQDYEPLTLQNGFVVYSSYRFYAQDGSPGPVRGERFLQRIETVLRTIRPDGSGDDLFYGAMRGAYFTPIRPTPDSLQYQGKHPRGHLVGVSVGQHREMADGTLVAVTPAGLTQIDPRLKRSDCERPLYPEILNLAGGEEVYIHNHDHMNPHGRYTTPFPAVPPGGPEAAADGWVYVSHAPWHDLRRNGYGIHLVDLDSRRHVAVYDDPEMSDVDPVPVYARPRPRVLSSTLKPNKSDTGRIYCVSVFNSDLPYDHDSVKYVRVIAARQQGITMNANASFRTRILGETPLEKDGSFYVEVPADTPLRFVLLDAQRQVVVHESAFNYVRPGETKGCIGCHEPKDEYIQPTLPLATGHAPARMQAKRGDLIYQGDPAVTYGSIVRD